MASPTNYPSWATNVVVDSLTGASNKVEPTEEFKLSGLLRGEYLARPFLNYQFNLLNDWVQHLDKVNVVSDLTGATDISRDNGKYQTLTLSGNTTLTESMVSGDEVDLVVTSGGFTLTYPASVDFGNAGEPTLATTDIINFKKVGSTVYATRTWSKT